VQKTSITKWVTQQPLSNGIPGNEKHPQVFLSGGTSWQQVMFGGGGGGGNHLETAAHDIKNSAESLNFEILVCFQHSYILFPWPPTLGCCFVCVLE